MIRARSKPILWPMYLWVSTALLAMGFGCWLEYQYHLFAVDGVKTTGQVDNRAYKIWHSKNGGVNYTYYFQYSYTVGPVVYHTSTEVTNDTWLRYEIGDKIAVKYLAFDSSQSRFDIAAEDDHYRYRAAAPLFIGFFMAVFGGALLGMGIFQAKRWKALLRDGAHYVGRVKSLEIANPNRRGQYTYLIISFRDITGNEQEVRTSALGLAQKSKWKVGFPIDVWCDRNDPNVIAVNLNANPNSSLPGVRIS